MPSSVQRVVLTAKRRASRWVRSDHESANGGEAPAERSTFCRAPSTSLYLDQMGDVRACCQNAEYPLGNVTEQSLREIWHGERTRELRRALTRSDLTLGCQFCRWQLAEDNDALVYARTFDHLQLDDAKPAWPRQLELSLSNACNLQCIMCNGDWSSSIRTHREGRPPLPTVYDDAFFGDLAEFLPHLEVVKLLGGEPFLGKEPLRVLDMLVDAGLTPEVHVTTNGTQWSPRVERIMERLPMVVILSLDGCDAETYESIRVGSDFAAVMENLDRFRSYARRHGTGVHLAHCLMTTNWHRFADFLRFADARDLPVGVNTVTSPVELSLHHLHPDRLDEVVAEMDAINDEVVASLGRNRSVWVDQLERLHHRQRALAEFADVSYYLGRTILGVPWRRRPDGRDHVAEARALVAAQQGHRVGPVLVVDDHEVVTTVEPADDAVFFGVDLAQLVGRPAAELFSVFDDQHGSASPGVLGDDPDLQHWRIVFDGPTGLVVDAVMVPVVDHAGVASTVQIHLCGRATPLTSPLPTAPAAPTGAAVGATRTGDGAAGPLGAPRSDAAVRDWLGVPAEATVHELLVDQEGTVLAIAPDPGDVLGMDLSPLVGTSVLGLIDAFSRTFGELRDRSELELSADAPPTSRLELVTFDGLGDGPVTLRVLMQSGVRTSDGHLGMRVIISRG